MPLQLFVTGMPRSGTTLVDKVLSLHPQAQVYSQPLPLLYVSVKAAFLESRVPDAPASARRYPLNDGFGPSAYRPQELDDFLTSFLLDSAFCRDALEAMVDFDGQYTKPAEPLRALDGYGSASLHDFVTLYLEELGPAGLRVLGAKETSCEEFVPYFLDRGWRVVMIVRDPRDVLTSLNHGRGHEFSGRPKPLLFNIRQWRKSVAVALAHDGRPELLTLRYEDLVRDPKASTARMTDFLGIDRLSARALEGELRSGAGEVWPSNSSHRATTRITTDSIGSHRRHLSLETSRFVQALCFAEMSELGYTVEIRREEVLSVLDCFTDSDAVERPELGDYVWCEARSEEERSRWRQLQTCEEGSLLPQAAHARLARWVRGGRDRN